jgi:hypothetical protein
MVAGMGLAPSAAMACPSGVVECGGVCCSAETTACFNGACDSQTCSNIVCGGVCCADGVVACFNGACDTAGLGSTCESLPCGTGCCTAEDPVCCGDGTCAATEGACNSGGGCVVAPAAVARERSAAWFLVPSALLGLAAMGALRRRRARGATKSTETTGER